MSAIYGCLEQINGNELKPALRPHVGERLISHIIETTHTYYFAWEVTVHRSRKLWRERL